MSVVIVNPLFCSRAFWKEGHTCIAFVSTAVQRNRMQRIVCVALVYFSSPQAGVWNGSLQDSSTAFRDISPANTLPSSQTPYHLKRRRIATSPLECIRKKKWFRFMNNDCFYGIGIFSLNVSRIKLWHSLPYVFYKSSVWVCLTAPSTWS